MEKSNTNKMKLTLTVVFFIAVSAFDEDIKISDLSGCREIRLNGENSFDFTVAINSLSNNKVNPNEYLRMKFFAIGFNFEIYFKSAEHNVDYIATINDPRNEDSCSIYSKAYCQKYGEQLQEVNCKNLTDSFDYTEFSAVITNDGFLQLFKNQEANTFLYANISSCPLPITELSFGRGYSEVDTRLLFDCPIHN